MRLRQRVLPLLLAAGLLVVSSCASGEAAPADVYHITEERHGQTIDVRLGQVVVVLLETKAGSPAHWESTVEDPAVLVQDGGPRLIAPRSGIVIAGTPGYERLTFRTLQPGSTRLRAMRVRPAREGGGTSVFEVTVRVVMPQ